MKKGLLILIIGFLALVSCLYALGADTTDLTYFTRSWREAREHRGDARTPTVVWMKLDPELAKAAGDGEWELFWAEEFHYPFLDESRWTAVERKKSFNNELQQYCLDHVAIKDGGLVLTATREGNPPVYTSGMVETGAKFSFCYGKIQARMKLPAGQGLFPAFWLLSESNGDEIDIMEMIGNEPQRIYGVNHIWTEEGPEKTFNTIQIETPWDFHIYELEWEKDELRWYVDGKLYHRSSLVPESDMYLIFTLAVGGDWPGVPNAGTEFPCSLVVDYVRLYRRR